MKIRIDKIIPASYVDGPGRRSVLFVQGCPLACPGCQNRRLWPAVGGHLVDVNELAEAFITIALTTQSSPRPRLTISGGEPFAQPEALAYLLRKLRDAERGAGHIIVYNGYILEQLLERNLPAVQQALSRIDVLVDGPYRVDEDSPWMQYRGSANQRIIDLPATLNNGEIVLLDWDRPEVIITETGQVLGTGPIIDLLAEAGLATLPAVESVGPARRCGQNW